MAVISVIWSDLWKVDKKVVMRALHWVEALAQLKAVT